MEGLYNLLDLYSCPSFWMKLDSTINKERLTKKD